MHLSVFSSREGGGEVGGIQQNNPSTWKADRTPKTWDEKLDTFSRSSKLRYITNLIAHPRDFGHN